MHTEFRLDASRFATFFTLFLRHRRCTSTPLMYPTVIPRLLHSEIGNVRPILLHMSILTRNCLTIAPQTLHAIHLSRFLNPDFPFVIFTFLLFELACQLARKKGHKVTYANHADGKTCRNSMGICSRYSTPTMRLPSS